MNVVKVKAEARGDFGRKAVTGLRNQGNIPCVMYGGDEVRHFQVSQVDIKPFVYSSDFHVLEVELDGSIYKSVVKDIQFHPVTEEVEHMDFQELVSGRKVKVSVPVKLVGDSLGVKEGGSLVTVIRKLSIKVTPENLVTELIGDISKLNLRQSIYVRDMEVPEGVEIQQDQGSPVGYIEVPRSLKSLESTAEDVLGIDAEEEGEEATEETAAE